MMRTLFVDGDGCNQTTRVLAERLSARGVKVVIVANRNIPLSQELSEMVICNDGIDAADKYIINHVKKSDFVITRDLSLAKILLFSSSGVSVMSDNGELYDKNSIDGRIMRSEHAKERRSAQSFGQYRESAKSSRRENQSRNVQDRKKYQNVSLHLDRWRLGHFDTEEKFGWSI